MAEGAHLRATLGPHARRASFHLFRLQRQAPRRDARFVDGRVARALPARARPLRQGRLLGRRRALSYVGVLWLNNRYFSDDDVLRENSGLTRDPKARPEMQFGAECTGVYYPRLLRDGWSLIQRDNAGRWNSWTVFEKPVGRDWTLRKIAHEQV